MPEIRPVTDLRNKFNELSKLCHKGNEPVFITKQGKQDMVIMSHTHYEMLKGQLEIYIKLGEAEQLDLKGDKGISHSEMMKRLKNRNL